MAQSRQLAQYSSYAIAAGTAEAGDGADIVDTAATGTATAASIVRTIARSTGRITALALASATATGIQAMVTDTVIEAGKLSSRGEAGNSGVRSLES